VWRTYIALNLRWLAKFQAGGYLKYLPILENTFIYIILAALNKPEIFYSSRGIKQLLSFIWQWQVLIF